jgi:hypothetical protein
MKQYRQGDVYLVKLTDKEMLELSGKTLEEIKPEDGKCVLAYGEVTGHSHYVPSSDAVMFEYNEETYLKVTTPTQLRHQEHDPIALDIGIYKRIQQVEYTPERIRNVMD